MHGHRQGGRLLSQPAGKHGSRHGRPASDWSVLQPMVRWAAGASGGGGQPVAKQRTQAQWRGLGHASIPAAALRLGAPGPCSEGCL